MNPNVIDLGVTDIPSASTEAVNISTFMMEVRNRLSRLEFVYIKIAQLKAALAESELARTTLQAQLDSATQSTNTESSKSSPVTTTATRSTIATPNVPPTLLTKQPSSDPPKKRKKTSATPPKAKAAATIGRLFAPRIEDSPSGFTYYVYFSQQVRRSIQELRSSFQGIGLNNARVLDIQYPLPNVVSFFLHQDYVLQFTSVMHKSGRGCSPLVDFDPCNPKNLKDPKFDSLPTDLRGQKAVSIENTRCYVLWPSVNQAQFDAILAEELATRMSSSEQERQIKRRRILYLGYLLTHDTATTTKILA